MDNIQKKIGRVRPPRVQITYDLETNGAKILKKLPYIMAILSDVSGDSEKKILYKDRKFINLNLSNISHVMEYLDVRAKILVSTYKAESESSKKEINLQLFGVSDFHPDNIIGNVDFLCNLRDNLSLLKDLKRKLTTNENSMNKFLEVLKDPAAVMQLIGSNNNSEKVSSQSADSSATNGDESKNDAKQKK
jgi:type VI secretion system protein ImpB